MEWPKIRMKVLMPWFGPTYPNPLMFCFHNSNCVFMMMLQILTLAGKQELLYLRNVTWFQINTVWKVVEKYTKQGHRHQNMTILKQQRSVGKLGEAKQKLRMIKIMLKDNLTKQVHSKTYKIGFTVCDILLLWMLKCWIFCFI